MLLDHLSHLLSHYGYAAVFGVVALESAGIPLPGESILITAAIFAGAAGLEAGERLNIAGVIAAAAGGAILGDNLGFWAGRTFGFRLLLRYRGLLRLDESQLKLGQYLFRKFGGAVVFFGRFIAFLRAFAAFLAGANRMEPRRFFFFNAAGAIVWASFYGLLGYVFGKEAHRLAGPLGLAGLAAVIALFAFSWRFYKRNKARLTAEAEQALPGPLSAEAP